MPDELRTRKLIRKQQLQVCQWLAEFKSPREAAALCKQDFGIEITPQAIWMTYVSGAKWKPVVQEIRQRFLDDLASTPIANKRVRLERLEKLYQRAESSDDRAALQQAIAALKQAQEEIEPGSRAQTVLIGRQEVHQHNYLVMDKDTLTRHLSAKLAAERSISGP